MSDESKAVKVTNTLASRSVVPFTGGLIVFVYAWFWPESYGHWLGTIAHSFLTTAGLL